MSNSFSLVQASPDSQQRVQCLLTYQAGAPLASNGGSASPTTAPHMMIRGSGTDSPMDLWGSTLAPLR